MLPTSIWEEAAEKMDPDSSQMCPMKGQESTNKGCNMGYLAKKLGEKSSS